MSSKFTASAPAGTKRKFSMFSSDQTVVQFELDGQRFTIHEVLLDEYSNNWRDYWCHAADSSSCEAPTCLLSDLHVSAWVVRGLVHWLYEREIPDGATIATLGCPSGSSSTAREKEMLVIDLATKLYCVGNLLHMERLQDDAMTRIFHAYQRNADVPPLHLLHYLAEHTVRTPEWQGVEKFFIHLMVKRKVAFSQLLDDPDDFVPESYANSLCGAFLDEILSGRNSQGGPLELSAYHMHGRSDCSCACKRGAANPLYFILK